MPDAPYVDRHIGGKRKVRDPDEAILRLARRQHGVVARRQLVELGVGPDAIDFRLRRGRLLPLHRAVYAAGHDALTREGRWMAAVLASGFGAVLSHRSAAAFWGIASRAGIDVTVPKQRRPPAGIELHVTPLPARRNHPTQRHTGDHGPEDPPRHGDHPSPASAGERDESKPRSSDSSTTSRSMTSSPATHDAQAPLPFAPYSRPGRRAPPSLEASSR